MSMLSLFHSNLCVALSQHVFLVATCIQPLGLLHGIPNTTNHHTQKYSVAGGYKTTRKPCKHVLQSRLLQNCWPTKIWKNILKWSRNKQKGVEGSGRKISFVKGPLRVQVFIKPTRRTDSSHPQSRLPTCLQIGRIRMQFLTSCNNLPKKNYYSRWSKN